MNPYEWPWENDPVESSDWTRVTTRLRKKVRKLSRRVSRMDREIRKMRKYLARMAADTAPRPAASERTRRLVGEAQRAAAAYTATRSAEAYREASRTRDALLSHVATLEAGDPPAPIATAQPIPHPSGPRTPRVELPPIAEVTYPPEHTVSRTGSSAPSPPSPLQVPKAEATSPSAEVPESIYRWIRDAVSLLRVAGFANEGHVILRSQLTDQALSLMARRPAADTGGPTLRQDAAGERTPIGRPRLGSQRGTAGPPSMAARSMPRPPEPPVAPGQTPPPPVDEASENQWPPRGIPRPGERPAMDSPGLDFPLADAPGFAPEESPAPDFHLHGIPEGNELGEDDGRWVAEEPSREGSDAPLRESQGPGDTGPRRWWSYAPVPPQPGE